LYTPVISVTANTDCIDPPSWFGAGAPGPLPRVERATTRVESGHIRETEHRCPQGGSRPSPLEIRPSCRSGNLLLRWNQHALPWPERAPPAGEDRRFVGNTTPSLLRKCHYTHVNRPPRKEYLIYPTWVQESDAHRTGCEGNNALVRPGRLPSVWG
jgi:hypothetical protein